jgi:hypothetical protein
MLLRNSCERNSRKISEMTGRVCARSAFRALVRACHVATAKAANATEADTTLIVSLPIIMYFRALRPNMDSIWHCRFSVYLSHLISLQCTGRSCQPHHSDMVDVRILALTLLIEYIAVLAGRVSTSQADLPRFWPTAVLTAAQQMQRGP